MVLVAKAITLYSAGGSVVSGVIGSAALGARRLRLPRPSRPSTLSQGDQSLKRFTVQAIQETKKDAIYKLIGLPALNPGELKFDYALPDITCALRLKAEIIGGKSVSLQLLAMVNMNANESYKKCDVTLVLNNAVSVKVYRVTTDPASDWRGA